MGFYIHKLPRDFTYDLLELQFWPLAGRVASTLNAICTHNSMADHPILLL